MSIRMQLVLTNHFEYSAIILNFRGEGDCHQHPSYKKYSINQYFNHICTQVWILCSSFECVFKMFFGRNTACFQCFFWQKHLQSMQMSKGTSWHLQRKLCQHPRQIGVEEERWPQCSGLKGPHPQGGVHLDSTGVILRTGKLIQVKKATNTI